MVGVRKLGNFCRLQLNVSPGALMDETRNSSLLTSDNILKSIFLHQLNLCIDDDEDTDNGADTFLYIPKYLNIWQTSCCIQWMMNIKVNHNSIKVSSKIQTTSKKSVIGVNNKVELRGSPDHHHQWWTIMIIEDNIRIDNSNECNDFILICLFVNRNDSLGWGYQACPACVLVAMIIL